MKSFIRQVVLRRSPPGSFGLRILSFFFYTYLNAYGYNPPHGMRESGELITIGLLGTSTGQGLAVDCGANVGDYTLAILRDTDLKVVCIEPGIEALSELKSLTKDYADRVQIFGCAVGSESGTAILYEVGPTGVGSTLLSDSLQIDYVGKQTRGNREVQIRTVDEILKEVRLIESWDVPVKLFKVDVEGLEFDVLKGASGMLQNDLPDVIQIEGNWHQLFGGHSLYDVSRLLPEYECLQILPHSKTIEKRNPADWLSNIYAHSNWVFVPIQSTID